MDGNNVTVYNAAGTYQQTITGSLNFPTGIAINAANRVYVASGNDIRIFDIAGALQGSISGNLNAPQGLAFDSAGNLYAANFFSNSISKFDSAGAFVTSWSVGTASPAFVAFQPAAAAASDTCHPHGGDIVRALARGISPRPEPGGFSGGGGGEPLLTLPRLYCERYESGLDGIRVGKAGIEFSCRRRSIS